MWRSINACYDLILQADENSMITKYFLRTLATQGKVEVITVGKKYLLNFLSVKEFLNIK